MKNYQKIRRICLWHFHACLSNLKLLYMTIKLMAFEMPYVEFEFESSVQTNFI